MAAKQINYYVENKYTEDIVYPYKNGEEYRYRKTEEGVLLIHKSETGTITERLLDEFEFPLSEFDRMKGISDEDYRKRNQGDVLEQRNTVSLTNLEETKICSQDVSAEDEYLNTAKEADDDDFRTLEKGMRIIDKCLTEKQKYRFMLHHYYGMTQEEIAKRLGLKQQTINQSLKEADKKIKKIKKFFPDKQKTPVKLPKNCI